MVRKKYLKETNIFFIYFTIVKNELETEKLLYNFEIWAKHFFMYI